MPFGKDHPTNSYIPGNHRNFRGVHFLIHFKIRHVTQIQTVSILASQNFSPQIIRIESLIHFQTVGSLDFGPNKKSESKFEKFMNHVILYSSYSDFGPPSIVRTGSKLEIEQFEVT